MTKDARPRREHPGKTRLASNLLRFGGKLLLMPLFRVRYEFPETLQTTGPVLILAKHRHELDIPLGYRAMLRVFGRHAWCIMKASLARRRYLGFFLGIGGIPLDRENPDASRKHLQYARKVLFERDLVGHAAGPGNMMVLFPEQTVYWNAMGEGRTAGFRFLAGKPPADQPLAVHCCGTTYRFGFPRGEAVVRFGKLRWFTREDDPAQFLHECMQEIAELSELRYDFPAPEARAARRAGTR